MSIGKKIVSRLVGIPSFALDDFGSGLSSFTYLKHLPVDFVKIDGSFVRNMTDSTVDRAIVAAINQTSHDLGIQTIAEWAENQVIIMQLEELGVDWVQGHGAGSPVPLHEISAQSGAREG